MIGPEPHRPPAVSPVFHDVIHAPHRLRTCVLLAAVESLEFAALRDDLGVADSVLSKHLKVLVDAGYARLDKPATGGRIRTWVRLTDEGRQALREHLAELSRMAQLAAPRTP
ncbi:MAG: transcriptional regulator [Austwickia sp.]|jgi:DNA-binding MarR family transcriptional regulator|nr:transcriptional regulator [Austwickia sp.]MBK8437226.1 transcriptional regulator [Austwickia sp.]MBK9102460.1 transcriptional regulator [Austwickia sp.]